MTEIQIGKVMLTPKGEYDGSKSYTRLDVVTYQGSSYVCLSDTSTTPPGANWQLLAIKGVDGQAGKDGSPGRDGKDGQPGNPGHDGVTPHIDATTGNWFIGTTNTGVKAQGPAGKDGSDGKPGSNGSDGAPGKDGVTPHIDTTTGHWFIGDTDTGIDSRGQKGDTGNPGNPGRDGQNGITPHIDSATGHWFIGTTDTGVSARGPQGQAGKDGAPGRDGKDLTDTVQVVTSGTLASLGIGKYEIQESASDAPTDDWGLLEVTVGQHYAKQVYTITGNDKNRVYTRVRDYDAANYGAWHAVTPVIDSSSQYLNKTPSDYQDGIFYEVKSVSSIGINRSGTDWSAQQGTTAIVTTKAYNGSAIQTAEVIDGTRPIVYMRVGKQSVWYSWEANTTW